MLLLLFSGSCTVLCCVELIVTALFLTVGLYCMQVTIGSPELKANHSIQQIVEVISDHEKYPRYVWSTLS